MANKAHVPSARNPKGGGFESRPAIQEGPADAWLLALGATAEFTWETWPAGPGRDRRADGQGPGAHRPSFQVGRTFEDAILRHFIDPLDEEDTAAIVRIWGKLRARPSARARDGRAASGDKAVDSLVGVVLE